MKEVVIPPRANKKRHLRPTLSLDFNKETPTTLKALSNKRRSTKGKRVERKEFVACQQDMLKFPDLKYRFVNDASQTSQINCPTRADLGPYDHMLCFTGLLCKRNTNAWMKYAFRLIMIAFVVFSLLLRLKEFLKDSQSTSSRVLLVPDCV